MRNVVEGDIFLECWRKTFPLVSHLKIDDLYGTNSKRVEETLRQLRLERNCIGQVKFSAGKWNFDTTCPTGLVAKNLILHHCISYRLPSKSSTNQSCHCRNARRSITGSPWSCKAIIENCSPSDVIDRLETLNRLPKLWEVSLLSNWYNYFNLMVIVNVHIKIWTSICKSHSFSNKKICNIFHLSYIYYFLENRFVIRKFYFTTV